MVIACPNCRRKYQIDTSRIPVGGTSFTCWSCRATVRVDPNAGSGPAASQPPKASPVTAGTPVTASPGHGVDRSADSSIPPSAMRFFESLAAEASMNRQMASTVPDTAVESDDAAPPASGAPQLDASAPAPPAAPTSTPSNWSEPVRDATDTIDALGANNVLDLPNLESVARPPRDGGDDVLELDLGNPQVDVARPLEPAPPPQPPLASELEPPAPSTAVRTMAFASEPPSILPEPPAPPPPRARPAPTPIPLPAQFQEQTVERTAAFEPAAAKDTAAQPFSPPPPVSDTVAIPAPTLATTPPATPAPTTPPPVTLFGQGERVTPAEMARSQTSAWVAPTVEDAEQRPSGRYMLVALFVLVVVGFGAAALWRYLLHDIVFPPAATPVAGRPAPPPPATPPPSQPAVAPTAETKTEQAPETAPESAPPPTATETAPESAVPSGGGGFTVQVRSSPSETDARAFADALRSAGFDAYVVKADLGKRGVWYRVRVGRFESREAARASIGKLRGTGRVAEAIVQTYEAP